MTGFAALYDDTVHTQDAHLVDSILEMAQILAACRTAAQPGVQNLIEQEEYRMQQLQELLCGQYWDVMLEHASALSEPEDTAEYLTEHIYYEHIL